MRVHSTKDDTPHFPFLYGEVAGNAMRNALNLRYVLFFFLPWIMRVQMCSFFLSRQLTRLLWCDRYIVVAISLQAGLVRGVMEECGVTSVVTKFMVAGRVGSKCDGGV
jgi:hypothetical protein